MVERGEFREDLYYRLKGFTLRIPPLRERKGDIVVLGNTFLRRSAQKHRKSVEGLSPSVWSALFAWKWPGNVRELAGVIETAVVVCDGECIQWHHLPAEYRPSPPGSTLSALLAPIEAARAALERQILLETLRRHRWHRRRTAEALGIDPKTLWRKVKGYQLEAPPFHRGESSKQE